MVANIRVKTKKNLNNFLVWLARYKKIWWKSVARGPDADRLEGDLSGIVMLIEFESKEAANTFY